MSIGAAFLLLAVVWALIHLVYYFATRNAAPLLPTQAHAAPRGRTAFLAFQAPRHTQVSLSGLKLQISTTRWNAAHDRLGTFLSRRANRSAARAVQAVYDVGAVLGALGLLLAVLGVCAASAAAVWTLAGKIGILSPGPMDGVQTLARRGLTDNDAAAPPRAAFPSIVPIIPGITVPLAHLPLIVGAVFATQVVHELGHALAGALELLPLAACGASLVACVPAAFVSFPDTTLRALPPRARARVIAAGPFHNLVLWGALLLAVRVGLPSGVAAVTGYRSVSDVGNVVVSVSSDSPLALHLAPGAIVTKLDDTPLAASAASADMWSDYLQGAHHDASLGWCIPAAALARSDACCAPSAPPSPLACFVTLAGGDRGCADPVPVLTAPAPGPRARCTTDAACGADALCVRPRADAGLLLISVRPDDGPERVVLWRGPRDEVWEEVRVGTWAPRIGILPLWLPPLAGVLYEYLTLATLSLFFVNLLPLPHLDGTALLGALLDFAAGVGPGASGFDFSALEAGAGSAADWDSEVRRARGRWGRRLRMGVPWAMAGIVGCYVFVSLLNFMF